MFDNLGLQTFSLAGTIRMNGQFLYREEDSRDIGLEMYGIAKL